MITGVFKRVPLDRALSRITLMTGCMLLAQGLQAGEEDWWAAVKEDHRQYYSWHNAAQLTAAFGISALMSQTDCDMEIQEWYQEDVRNETTDDLSAVVKPTGDVYVPFAFYTLATAVGRGGKAPGIRGTLGLWGQRGMRATAVGMPTMLLMQRVAATSRPFHEKDTRYRFWGNDGGVSGHAFIGAMPFLTAAELAEPVWLKSLWYCASALPALSRVNDEKHFASQALLGWFMAWRSVRSVDASDRERNLSVGLSALHDGAAMSLAWQF